MTKVTVHYTAGSGEQEAIVEDPRRSPAELVGAAVELVPENGRLTDVEIEHDL